MLIPAAARVTKTTKATKAKKSDAGSYLGNRATLHYCTMRTVTPAPMPAPVERRRVSFSAESLFAFDKSVIKPEGKAALDRFVNELRGTQFERIGVEGHADRLGSNAYNQRLSTQRAEAVKSYLISTGGVAANKISAAGKGETMPVTKPGDCRGNKRTAALVACLQPDRRVDVEMTGTTVIGSR